VTGAAVGIGLNEGVGGGLYDGLGVGLALGEVLLLAELLALAEPLALGEKPVIEEVGVDAEVPVPVPVHAESATQVSTVMRPQPMAVGLSRCALDAMAVRAPIEPSSCSRQSPFPDGQPQKPRGRAFAGDRPGQRTPRAKTPATLTVSPGCGANPQWRAHHRNITLVSRTPR
jgi:hypothetical protein